MDLSSFMNFDLSISAVLEVVNVEIDDAVDGRRSGMWAGSSENSLDWGAGSFGIPLDLGAGR